MANERRAFTPLIVGIGGTARPDSTSERAVAQALRVAERHGACTRLFDGEFVSGRLPRCPGGGGRRCGQYGDGRIAVSDGQ
jgi:FMN reductase